MQAVVAKIVCCGWWQVPYLQDKVFRGAIMDFAKKLLEARRSKHLSQEGLAEIIGVSRQAIAKWEQAESWPEIEKVILLADYFQLSIDSLLRVEQKCSVRSDQLAQSGTAQSEDFLPAFLCRAKKASYAGNGPEIQASRPGSHDLSFREGELFYYDSWLGGEKFVGEEALWRADHAIWSMNYLGRVIDSHFSGDFLKECLSLVELDMPFRGPLVHCNGKYHYHCSIEGNFDWFKGQEDIFYETNRVYECIFHGGSLG